MQLLKRQKHCSGIGIGNIPNMEYVGKYQHMEYQWNIPIKTSVKPHIVWDRHENVCAVIDVSCPSDVSMLLKIKEKDVNCERLSQNLRFDIQIINIYLY